MTNTNEYNLDEETVRKLGLQPSNSPINAQIAPNARIFNYPGLENVFVMESDLYGNIMPKGSCFLAFYGTHGLIGKHMQVEELKSASKEEIQKLVQNHSKG